MKKKNEVNKKIVLSEVEYLKMKVEILELKLEVEKLKHPITTSTWTYPNVGNITGSNPNHLVLSHTS